MKVKKYKKFISVVLSLAVLFAVIPFNDFAFAAEIQVSDLVQGAYTSCDEHLYVRYDNKVSWHRAKELCEQMGGYLATITTAKENAAVATLIPNSYYNQKRYFLGATDEVQEGTWTWVSGEKFDLTFWTSGQPDNKNNRENYLVMSKNDGSWRDDDDADNNSSLGGFICEFNDNYIPVKQVENNGHIYSLFNENLTWEEAEAVCVAFGGHLVSITDSNEQRLIENLITSGIDKAYWIGASDDSSEGTWTWTTEEPFSYNNWSSGQPNNTNGIENYAAVYKENGTNVSKNKWNDTSVEGEKFGFICEVDSNSINADYSFCNFGNRYEVYNKSLSWNDAELFAEINGGHLVTITSSLEQKMIESMVGGSIFYWMGLSNNNVSREWKWVTGEGISYSNWADNEPNNTGNKEFFGQLYTYSYNLSDSFERGQWIDNSNNIYDVADYNVENCGFIVEYDNYYTLTSFDEKNGSEINYFVEPSENFDYGLEWKKQADGCLQTSGGLVSIVYNPQTETFTFDSNGESLNSYGTGINYCEIPFNVKQGQYITLYAFYESENPFDEDYCGFGFMPISSSFGSITLDEDQFSFNNYKKYSKYTIGPLNKSQADSMYGLACMLSFSSDESFVLDNLKVKLCVNITDSPVDTPQYSMISKNLIVGEEYGNAVNALSKPGYIFNGWTDSDNNIVNSEDIVEYHDYQVLEASWSEAPFTVSFNANGGNCETNSKTVYYSKPYGELPTPTREDYLFLGWYTKKKGGSVVMSSDTFELLSGQTLYACWAKADSDKCGDNLTWSLEGNKLIISGSGNMYDYSAGNAPWSDITSYISSVEIQDGVTSIGSNAFYGCTVTNEFIVPDTITEIGEGAFENCFQLKVPILPPNVTTINESVFENCTALTSVELPLNIAEVCDGAFDGCNSIQSITVYNPNCVMPSYWITANDDAVIYGYSGSTAEEFAENEDKEFVSIGSYGESDGITWIFTEETKTLEIIGSGEMPDYGQGNTPWNSVSDEVEIIKISDDFTSIGNNAFCDCKNLYMAVILDNITDIGQNVLPSSSDELFVYGYKNSAAERYCASNSIEFITVGEKDPNGGFSWFFEIDEKTLILSGNGVMPDYGYDENNEWIDPPWYQFHNEIESVNIENGITNIAEGGFHNCNYLDKVTIPDSVKSIGDGAFGGCNNLTEITIPGSCSGREGDVAIGWAAGGTGAFASYSSRIIA